MKPRFRSVLPILPLVITLSGFTSAQTVTKQTTGSDLTTGASWVGGTAPGTTDVATWVTGSLGGALTIGSDLSWQGIDLQSATSAITTSGAGILTLGSSGINIASTGVHLTIGNSRTFSASSNITVGAGRILTLNGGITTFADGTTTTLNGTGEVQFGSSSNAFAGNGALVVSSGILRNNLQAVPTTLRSGATTLQGGAAFYQNSTANLLGTGTLTIGTGGATIGGGSGADGDRSIINGITLNDALTIQNEGTSNSPTTLSGVISGTAGITKNATGTGALIVTNSNSYQGSTTLNAGTIQIGNNSALGTGTLTINAGTVGSNGDANRTVANNIVLNGTGTFASASTGGLGMRLDGVISGSGGLTVNGASGGILTLTNSNTFEGATTVTSGYIAIANNALANSSSVSLGASTRLWIGVNGTTSINNLSGNSTASIRTDFTITGTSAARTLLVNQTADGTYAGGFSEGGSRPISLTKAGAATLTLTGAGTYTGSTTVNAGTLKIGGAGQLAGGTYAGSITNNATLHFDSTANQRLTGALSGTGTLLKTGTGTLILNSNNTYAGTITVDQGVFQLGNNDNAGFIGNEAIVVNNASMVWNRTGDSTVGNAISGTGSITKQNTGALTLFGNNTYSGTTTISAGTLRIGSGATTGSLGSGAVINNSALVFNRSNDLTAANDISGDGTVTKEGTGTLTLSGTNTYNGATTVSAGRLNLTGTLTSAVAVGNAAAISGTGSTTGLLTLNSGGIISVAGGATLSSLTANGVTFAGASALDFVSAPVTGTTYDVVTYGSGTLTGLGNFSTSDWRGTVADTGTKITFAASGATRTWNTTDGTWDLNTAANFQEGDQKFLGGDSVVFGERAAAGVVSVSGTLKPASVTVNNTTNAYTFSGSGGIAGTGSLVKSGNGSLILNVANTYTGGTTLHAGTLQAGNASALGTGTLTINGGTLTSGSTELSIANNITLDGSVIFTGTAGTQGMRLNGVISGSGGITKEGTGRVSLANDSNTYSGATAINAGILATTLGALSNSSSVTLGTGGTLAIGSNGTTYLKNLSGASGSVISSAFSFSGDAARTLSVNQSVDGTFAGSISEGASRPISLVKDGSAVLILTTNNAYTGTTTISSGTLQIGSGGTTGTTGSGAVSVASGAQLVFNRSNTQSLANAFSGSGTIALRGGTGSVSSYSGNWISFTNTASFSSPTLHLDTGASLTNRGEVVFGDQWGDGTAKPKLQLASLSGWGYFRSDTGSTGNRTISVNQSVNTDYHGRILQDNTSTRSIHLEKLGDGILTLTGANAYQNTIVGGGTLRVGGSGNIGSTGAISIASNATFHFDSSATQLLSGNISGSGTLRNSGGLLRLTGTNPFSGLINIEGGDVVLDNTGSENGAPSVNMSGGRFILSSPFAGQTATIGNLTGTAGIINPQYGSTTGVRTLQVNQTVDGAFAGNIQDGGGDRFVGLIKTGTAALTLSGSASNYTGGTTLSQGTLIATHGSALGTSGTVTINDTNTGANHTTLRLGNVTMARPITVANQGSGTVTLGANGSVANPEFSGAITLNKAVTLDGSTNTDRLTFSGGIGGTGDVTISGTGRVVFNTTANTYNGTTTINAGSILQLGVGSGTTTNFIPDASVVNTGTGSFLKLAKGSNNETIGGLTGTGTVRGHEAVTSAASELTIDTTGNHSFGGVLENGGASGATLSLIKDGSGTQTLTGTNTYSGATTITNGTLLIDGSTAAGSAVTVASVAKLGGTGTVGGSTTVSGTLAPGNSVGKLSFGNNLTFNSASIFAWEMNYDAGNEGAREINYDAVNVTGALGGSDAIFRIVLPGTSSSFADGFWTANRIWSDIFISGSGNLASVFSVEDLEYYNADGLITAPNALTQGSFTISGTSLNWSAVPEPTTALGGLLLAAGLLRRRRHVA